MYFNEGIPSNLIGNEQLQVNANNSPVPSLQSQNTPIPNQPQVQITEEQLSQIQQLVSNPDFESIRQQAQTNPQILPQLLENLHQSDPALFQLFTQNPQLLVALLMGDFPEMEEEEEEYEDEEEDEDEFEGNPQALELTEQDYQVINNVC
jgi:hypothetical protein